MDGYYRRYNGDMYEFINFMRNLEEVANKQRQARSMENDKPEIKVIGLSLQELPDRELLNIISKQEKSEEVKELMKRFLKLKQ